MPDQSQPESAGRPRRRRPQPKQISARRTRFERAEQSGRERRARANLTRFHDDGDQDD